MATTQNTYTGNGATTNYSFTFPYLDATDIKVSLNGVDTTAYTLANATTIAFTTAPTNGASIRIYRVTDDSALAATFFAGSAIRSEDLNDNYTQILYRAQEVSNYSVQDAGSVTLAANYTFATSPSAPTPTSNSHLVTKQYADGLLFNTTGIADGDKGDISISGSGTVWSINSSAVTGAKIGTGAVTASKLGTSAVTESKIDTAAVTPTKLDRQYTTIGLALALS